MSLIQMLVKEMQQEAQTTRKMLERVPNDKYDWQPHPKSMTIRQLTTHIADLPSWVALALTTDGLDFATSPYSPEPINNTDELLDYFERSLANGETSLSNATDDQLNPMWTLRNGDTILSKTTNGEVIRMTFSQIVHHRAQLGVDLRLLNVPIPGSYGPSADETGF
ncbi:DinB family protein [Spirosoma pollinicola]|uniref:Damage-inducible protein DinB n=1 Tax=Spirosoma pollinicola TaxID=2057025 RepID=A0A2K8Z1L4_9BACT|nr:DinB family protein [Spirosoma pollinicola]AUD03704.1 damage-inducible protein DinB [Spirosoma pollinicola]